MPVMIAMNIAMLRGVHCFEAATHSHKEVRGVVCEERDSEAVNDEADIDWLDEFSNMNFEYDKNCFDVN